MARFVCFGENFFSQLGTTAPCDDDTDTSLVLPFAPSDLDHGSTSNTATDLKNVRDFALGSKFTAVLSSSGKAYVCGNLAGTSYPSLTKLEVRYPIKCTQLAAGRKHMLMLMEGGHVMSLGIGYFGQLGHGSEESFDIPEIIKNLEPNVVGSPVVRIACGGCHSGVVTEEGRVFMFGLNRQGQCGMGPQASDAVNEPRPVHLENRGKGGGGAAGGIAGGKSAGTPVKVKMLVCGRNHSALLTNDGRVFTFGAASFGRLGLGSVKGPGETNASKKLISTPTEVPFFKTNTIAVHSIASGDMHMTALAHDCSLYSWGHNNDGQCGTGDLNSLLSPKKIVFFDASLQVVSIECGSSWSMAVTAKGALYAWGCNDKGYLGIPRPVYPDPLPLLEPPEAGPPEPNYAGRQSQRSTSSYKHIRCFDSYHNVLLPTRVRSLAGHHVEGVRCGGSHNIVLVRPRSPADVAADAKDVPADDDNDDYYSRLHITSAAQDKHSSGAAKREFADKTIATGGFGYGQPVNSKEDAKTSLRHGAKADSTDQHVRQDKEGGPVGPTTGAAAADAAAAGAAAAGTAAVAAPSSAAVAQTLASYEVDELAAQCISWARHCRVAEIEYALSRGADVNVRDASGNTMLIVAAQNGHRAVLELLVDRGADLNVTNSKGNSALHYLFAYGFQAEAEMLISKGADDYAQNLEGYTCYEMGLID